MIFDNIKKNASQIRDAIESEDKGYDGLVQDISTIFGQSYVGKMKASDYLKAAVGWVYGCVGVISDEVAGTEFSLKKISGGQATEVDDHPALDLIHRPNNVMTKFDLIKLTFEYLELTGEAPWFIAYKNGLPANILLLRPDRLSLKPGQNGEVVGGYTYKINGTAGVQEIDLEPQEVIVLKYPDPDMPLRGKGPLQAAATTYDLDNNSEKWNSKFFKNSAAPDVVLKTEQKLQKETRERIERKIEAKYKGVDNAHKTIILEGGLSMDKLTLTQKEMDFIEQQRFSRDKILAIFRVPRTALGITDDVNRANAEATDYVFAKRTIKPKLRGFIEQLNEFLLPLFKGTETMVFDFKDPVPENVEQDIAKATAGIQGGYMTINEARALNNLDPIDGGDTLRDPNSMAPITNEPTQNGIQAKRLPVTATRSQSQYIRAKNRKGDTSNRKREEIKKIVTNALLPIIYDNLKKKFDVALTKKFSIKQKIFSGTPQEKKEQKYIFQEKQLKLADKYEEKVAAKLTSIFNTQKDIILKGLDADLRLKLDPTVETLRYDEKLKPIMVQLLREQATAAFQLLGQQKSLAGAKAAAQTFLQRLTSYFEKRNFKISPEIVKETNSKLQAAFTEASDKGESIPEIKKRVSALFDDMASYRSERIARTEVIRGSNFATEEAYIDSGVVEAKEWLATKDERTDADCMELDGKIIPLKGTYQNKEENGYETVTFPPLHVNCRCTLIPVIGTPHVAGTWRPSMSLDEAKQFTADSKIKDTFFHGTTNQFADNIEKNGFNILHAESTGGNIVDGIYFTRSKDQATEYAMSAVGNNTESHAKPAVLPVKLNVRKVKASTFQELYNAMHAQFGVNFTSAQVQEALKAQGYDALLMHDEVVNQDYLAVFDQKNVVVVRPKQ